jgi:uncharacterized protein YciI
VPVFIVERPVGSAWDSSRDTREQRLWDEHAAFMDDLFERGLVVLGGPLADGSGHAVVVMEAAGEAEVRDLLAGDPWCVHDILGVNEIREWRIFLDARRRPRP